MAGIAERNGDLVRSNAILWGYLAVTCLALAPLLFVTLPPMVDLPNHIARFHILATYEGNAELQNNYVPAWRLRTYLLPDLLCVALAKVLPIYVVGKLYVAVAIAAIAGSTFWLSKQLVGWPSPWIFAACLLLFNHPLSWGFVNFLLATSLALTTFGLWLKHDGQPPLINSIMIGLLALATYFTHVIPLGVLGILLAANQLQFQMDKFNFNWQIFFTRWLRIGFYFVIPAILFLNEDAGETVRSGPTIYGGLASKLRAIFSPTLFNGNSIEFCTWVFLVSTFGFLLWSGKMQVCRNARLPLVFVTVVAMAMPLKLTGVFGLDFRLPVIVCLLCVAGIVENGVTPRLRNAIVLCGLALLLARTLSLTFAWREWDRQVQEFRTGIETVELGARVLTVGSALPCYYHLNALAAIERSAFVPTLFTGATLLRASEATQGIDTPSGIPLSLDQLTATDHDDSDGYHSVYWSDWKRDFDYVIWLNPSDVEHQTFGGLSFAGSFFAIYEIEHRPGSESTNSALPDSNEQNPHRPTNPKSLSQKPRDIL